MINIKSQTVNRLDVMDGSEWLQTRFTETNEGFLIGDAIITNIGVFTYIDNEGNVLRELRPPEEVFSEDSLKTLKLKPITNNHPKELVTADNIKKYQIGNIGDRIWTDSYFISVPMIIQDLETIQDIKNGKRALSCGYQADIDYTSGNWMGVEYDAIQRNIKYNHLAVVDKGRAGDFAKMKLDGIDNFAFLKEKLNIDETNKKFFIFDYEKKEDKSMDNNLKVINIDGVDYQAEADVIKKLNQLKIDNEKLTKDVDTKTKDFSKLQADHDTLSDKLDIAEKKIVELGNQKIDDSEIQKRINERLSIIDSCKKAEVEFKEDESDIELKKKVIVKVFPNVSFDGKDEVYIIARYDSAIDILATKNDVENKIKTQLQTGAVNTDKNDDPKKAYEEKLKNLYKGGN